MVLLTRLRPLLAGAASLVWAGECEESLRRGQAAFDAHSFAAAAAEFERATTLCTNRVPVLVSLGQVQYLLGKLTEAEASLKSAVRIEPHHVPALYALGRVYYQQNRLSEAVEQLTTVVQLEPKHYRAWDNLGVCFDGLQRDADALKAFFKALDLVMKDHPGYDVAHADLADFFLRREQYEKAFQLAAEAAHRNPLSARNAFLTGKALTRLGKEEISLRWLEQAVKLDPNYSEAWYLLAQTCRKTGKSDRAAEALARFRELSKEPQRRR
jgi:tetratricopeptide (TPR) repeat protein